MATTEQKPTEITEDKKECGEDCTEHDHDHDDGEHGESAAHKASKGEKKFKKAIGKMGMKPVEGIERVTIKTAKDFVMYIDNPEVVTTGAAGSYIIFGEAKFLDFSSQNASRLLDKMKETQTAKKPESKTEPIKEEAEEEETEEAGDIPEESINTIMEYASCSRAKAIKCLKKTKGDVVEAITLAS
jgi:nascent polypeptide-associated complex subunit alpha